MQSDPTPATYDERELELRTSPLEESQPTKVETFGQMIKIVLVGEAAVGKTALVHRYMKNTMPPETLKATVAVEFGKRSVIVEHRRLKVQVVLWDTAG